MTVMLDKWSCVDTGRSSGILFTTTSHVFYDLYS
jgi:hypothetical protein